MSDITVYVDGDEKRPRAVPVGIAEAMSLVDGQAITGEQATAIAVAQLDIALGAFANGVIAAAVEAARRDREGSK